MDTREKIVSEAEAVRIAAAGATVVSGYFDPLVASHAARLASLKKDGVPMLVLISIPPRPILDVQARAQLVAGLACVDHVAETASGPTPHFRLEPEDQARLNDLVAHVHARQKA
jgi:hypothetical protein